ncbi:MAG: LCP family protein [Nocardioidaceae bacterium]
MIPGSGFWFAGRRLLGVVVFAIAAASLTVAIVLGVADPRAYLHAAFKTDTLMWISIGCIVTACLWIVMVVTSHWLLRPSEATRSERASGIAVVLVLCLAIAIPLGVGAYYANIQRTTVVQAFPSQPQSQTAPQNMPTQGDPWTKMPRVNILLLGGDGGNGRIGVRTDSMILASVDTKTGNTVLFSLPRNLENAPFPKDSPLHRLYPRGFTGPGDVGNWLLNAIYRMVPIYHPGVLGPTDNEGADALKLSVGDMLGLHVDYYVLINLAGFRELIDALGGITVNIDKVVPIGGNLDTGQPPTGWIQPGPNKHLDGFDALWFARGRWNTDDYDRMQRQRCVIDAMIQQANPQNVLLRYEQIAKAGSKIVTTDLPRGLLPALVDLGLKIKDASVHSVVFQPSAQFNPADPDIAYMRSVVQKALNPSPAKHQKPKIIQSPQNACAYHPGA